MFEVDGLDEFTDKLERIAVEFPEEIEKEIYKLANKLLRKVKQRTPVGDTGELRRNWQIGDLVKAGNYCYIEVINNTEYAKHVEYGHRTRLGTSNSEEYKSKGTIAYVPGVHMLKISVEELNKQLSSELRKWINKVLGG